MSVTTSGRECLHKKQCRALDTHETLHMGPMCRVWPVNDTLKISPILITVNEVQTLFNKSLLQYYGTEMCDIKHYQEINDEDFIYFDDFSDQLKNRTYLWDLRTIKNHRIEFGFLPASLKNMDSISMIFSDGKTENCIIWLGILTKFAVIWTKDPNKWYVIEFKTIQMISETVYSKFEADLSGDGITLWVTDTSTGRREQILNRYNIGSPFQKSPYLQLNVE